MKLLRSFVMLSFLAVLPMAAMWKHLSPHLGSWAEPIETLAESIDQTLASLLQQSHSPASTDSTTSVEPIKVELPTEPEQPLSPLPEPLQPAPARQPKDLSQPTELPGPAPAAVNSSAETPAGHQLRSAERTLQQPVYRPMATNPVETIQREIDGEAFPPAEVGQEAARLDTAAITSRLRNLGATGYRLQTDASGADYHFEASFLDPDQPQGQRRFTASDTNGQLAMQRVLQKVELWHQQARID